MLTLQDFEKRIIEDKECAALCFTADWCLPSKTQIDEINKIKDNYKDKFLIEIINVEESKELTQKLRINNLPTTLFFADGELQEQNCLYGYQDSSMLTDSFECTLWELENKSPANKYIWWIIGALLLVSIIVLACN